MSTPNAKHCSPEILLEMAGNDREIFLQLVEIFFRESRNQFVELKSAAAAGDLMRCGNHSHSLKGTVGALGADNLVKMLQKLEDDCHQKRGNCGAERVAMMSDELNRVRIEVRQFVATL
jgi:HPt (histidine-containing phosphotransfer) domain-containing protein